MILNIVVGTPLVSPETLLAYDMEDWLQTEKGQTMFTEQRFLPAILKDIGVVPSINEVRRNRADLMITLDRPDCFWVKWGKKRLYIVVGEQALMDLDLIEIFIPKSCEKNIESIMTSLRKFSEKERVSGVVSWKTSKWYNPRPNCGVEINGESANGDI